MELQTIKTTIKTKYEFDKLQLDLKHKGILRTQDELVKLLINSYKENLKEKKK